MPAPTSFRFDVHERVGVLTFTRPDTLNSLTFEVYREMRDLFFELERDPAVASVVITGEGRGFCSGGDVSSIIGELFSRDMPGLVEFTRMTWHGWRRACNEISIAGAMSTTANTVLSTLLAISVGSRRAASFATAAMDVRSA